MSSTWTAASRRPFVVAACAVLLAAAVLASLALGSRTLPPAAVPQALVSPDGGDATAVVRSLRLPRTVTGIAAGAGLALAGVLMQALTRNPLADPRIMGVTSVRRGGSPRGVRHGSRT
ncbi:MAG: iron chelate uptake ABC transporter family permease subunit [Streptosporangiales bacterium]|nr:iron chelate uptake ABC transporter family permease subunit [Streptosporangiales bacterium]